MIHKIIIYILHTYVDTCTNPHQRELTLNPSIEMINLVIMQKKIHTHAGWSHADLQISCYS